MTTARSPRTATADVPATTGVPWWRDAVIYQVYVRSFADADGDGVGDLRGLRARLPYLAGLGVDGVWLSPFYRSPQVDAGYDIADHCDVDPVFGTMEDALAAVAEAHRLGLRVILDVVPNHTSDQHAWFQAALADADSPRRRHYLFRDGRGPGGELPPNNWRSQFGGRAWTRVRDGSWYLHLFAREQPDLNWADETVVDAFHGILRFWLDRGVDGFRVDTANGLAKHPLLPDLPSVDGEDPPTATHPYWDRDEVHDIYRGWRRVLDSYPGDRMAVVEAWVRSSERLARYVRGDELHTAFAFDFLRAPWQAKKMREIIDDVLAGFGRVGAPATWVLSNHDVVRHATRYGGGELGRRRARAAALLLLALPGCAAIYQGDELGLEEVADLPREARKDPAFLRTGGEHLGRDGCRVPIPWSGTAPPFGFGPPGSTPWLPQPPGWASQTVEAQQRDTESMLALYRRALAARRAAGPADSTVSWLDAADDVLAFRRPPALTCVINLGDRTAALPGALAAARPVLASGPGVGHRGIPADTAAWYADDD